MHAGSSIHIERFLACYGVIDDRLRVISANNALSLSLDFIGHLPWFVHVFLWHTVELGQPSTHIITLRVRLLALQHRVEDTEIGSGISAGAGRPLPTSIIGRRIAVYKVLHEITFTPAPID